MSPQASARLCSGCRQIIRGRCPTCTKQQRQEADQARGSSTERGYGSHWRRVIRPAFLRANPICVLCGSLAHVPDHWPETRASLVARGVEDPDAPHRLRALCKECHDLHGLSYRPWAPKRINTLVTLVAGPPCAGKNTYVTQHAEPSDTVVDYDAIMAGLTGRPMHEHDEARMDEALAIRDQQISQLLASGKRGWVIASAPSARDRHQYRTNVVLLMPTMPEAIARCRVERPAGWETYVRRWYERYEPDDRDTLPTA